ncbi:uncharacterized protein BT62DRAFT_1071059 [Guyanagaster necrorhizus]|uniref:Uncharacterized protein n=1 Tax=Guyanagaster necrorhizus TaxID=856835 RepID=A0A9P8AXJ2_9AGAR|nr:uncharacterized protein BT62DRAFT_1071059 [Guyanagaster necrorhizus MCA 3950]KAG7451849.1 hypothetical protein BT62DRAFT_1071059 [Guyanagaster necrorhizus MCA 3950]
MGLFLNRVHLSACTIKSLTSKEAKDEHPTSTAGWAFCYGIVYYITRGVIALSSLMATQINIPSNLTDAERAFISTDLDGALNSRVLYSLLLGLYTGIVAVTLGNIFMNKDRPTGRGIVVTISLLHIATAINFGLDWVYIRTIFVKNGQSSWAEYVFYNSFDINLTVGMGTTGAICTVLADSTMIWRCWMVWGRRWQIILLPTLFLSSTIVFKIIATYRSYATINGYTPGYVLQSAFILATTLSCTSLIIYRIVTVARAGGTQVGGGVGAYRHVIEVFIESSALYSLSLITYVVVFSCNTSASPYIDIITGTARGIAPTLLVGRVAAGHARSDDSWQGSIVSSLRFGAHSRESQQDSSATSTDLEGQQERSNEYDHSTSMASSADNSLIHQGHRETQRERPANDSNAAIITVDIC